jgi:hypothetical protein
MTEFTVGRSGQASKPDQTSRTAGLYHDLRRMPLFRQLAPMEAGIGWPIPVRHRPGWRSATSVYVRLPLFGFRPRAGEVRLYPPFAVITLAWASQATRPRPLEYADLRFAHPWAVNGSPEPVGTFPHPAVRGTVAEYLAHRDRLFGLYDELLDGLQAGVPFRGPAYQDFGELLRMLMEPSMERYYRSLAPKFCQEFLGAADPAS